MPDASALFKRHFGYQPVHTLHIPAGLTLLGQHADGREGLALTAALSRGITFASAPRTDGRVELVHANFEGRARFWMSDLKPDPGSPWADVIKSSLERLRRRGANFSGFTGAIQVEAPFDRAPQPATLLALATLLSVRRMYPFGLSESGIAAPPKRNSKHELPPLTPLEKWQLADLCGSANRSGKANLLAPAASLHGGAWQVASLDLRFRTAEKMPVVGAVFILCVPAASGGMEVTVPAGGEAPRPEGGAAGDVCVEVIRKLSARSLRSVEMRFLEANRSKLTSEEYEFAHHAISENSRVVAAERALRDDDVAQFGQYLVQGYESRRDLLRTIPADVDLMVQLVRGLSGCLGVCAAGEELPGGVVSLVAHHQAESFVRLLTHGYAERSGQKLSAFVCQPVAGPA